MGGSTPEVAVQPWSLTPITTWTSPTKQPEKKRKRNKKDKEVLEEGDLAPLKDLKPQRRAKVAKGTQRKNMAEGSSLEMVPDHCPRVPI